MSTVKLIFCNDSTRPHRIHDAKQYCSARLEEDWEHIVRVVGLSDTDVAIGVHSLLSLMRDDRSVETDRDMTVGLPPPHFYVGATQDYERLFAEE